MFRETEFFPSFDLSGPNIGFSNLSKQLRNLFQMELKLKSKTLLIISTRRKFQVQIFWRKVESTWSPSIGTKYIIFS